MSVQKEGMRNIYWADAAERWADLLLVQGFGLRSGAAYGEGDAHQEPIERQRRDEVREEPAAAVVRDDRAAIGDERTVIVVVGRAPNMAGATGGRRLSKNGGMRGSDGSEEFWLS